MTPTGAARRTNDGWLTALRSAGPDQAAALVDLRAALVRASLFTLQRARHQVGHLGPSALHALAEDCAQEALTAILQRLDDFRGDSRFTTWAYAFAVNMALVAARRERWATVSLDRLLDGERPAAMAAPADDTAVDPERHAVQGQILAAIREGIEHHLTPKQQQVLRAIVFDGVPLDELVRHWDSNRNAVYKLVHDARRKLKAYLASRGLEVGTILEAFGARR